MAINSDFFFSFLARFFSLASGVRQPTTPPCLLSFLAASSACFRSSCSAHSGDHEREFEVDERGERRQHRVRVVVKRHALRSGELQTSVNPGRETVPA
jgi:hypothetical protein